MRTTLILDDDVASPWQAEVRRSGKGMKELGNEYLRLALNERRCAPESKPFRVRASDMGPMPGLSCHNIGELLEEMEGQAHR